MNKIPHHDGISKIVGKSSLHCFENNSHLMLYLWNRRENLMFFCTAAILAQRSNQQYQYSAKIDSLKHSRPSCVAFGEKKFKIEYDGRMWKISVRWMKDIRLQCLQWKILHNIYPTRIMLYKLILMETMNCSYCPNETDFIEHLFLYVWKCVPLWKYVENMLNAFHG